MDCLRQRHVNERGSFSLSTLITTAIGVSFALLVVDAVKYLEAHGAVGAAVRTALRCVVPTDGVCSEMAETTSESLWRWSTHTQTPAYAAEYHQYRASVEEQPWSARYTKYSIPQFSAVAQIEGVVLPVDRYTAPLAREKRFAIYQGNVLSQGYFEGSWFPQFHAEEETGRDGATTYTIQEWGSSMARRDGAFSLSAFQRRVFPAQVIRAGEVKSFSTGMIRVPALPGNGDAECRPGISSCSLAQRASTSGELPGYDFRKEALVAIKIFADVEPISSKSPAQVRWAKALTGPEDGLQLIVSDGADRFLGGRALSPPITQKTSFPLWIRGPANAVGSLSQSSDHSGLRVRRGSSFAIRAFMVAKQPARVKVTILYYFDSPTLTGGTHLKVTSKEVPMLPSQSEACPPSEVFTIDSSGERVGKGMSIENCTPMTVRHEATCEASSETFPIQNEASLQPELYIARCQGVAGVTTLRKPALRDEIPQELHGQQLVCGSWQRDDSFQGSIEVPAPNGYCPARLRHTSLALDCGTQSGGCTASLPLRCDNAANLAAKLNSESEALRSDEAGQNPSHPLLDSAIPSIDPHSIHPAKVVHAGVREFLNPDDIPPQARPCTAESSESVTTRAPHFRRQSGAPPTLSSFAFTPELARQALASPELLTLSSEPSTLRAITKVYPFNASDVPEIGIGTPNFAARTCDHAAPIPSLEDRLRLYASEEIRELLDKDTVFHVHDTPLGTRSIGSGTRCDQTRSSIEDFHPCSRISQFEDTALCQNSVELGIFPAGVVPEPCRRSGITCSKERVDKPGAPHSQPLQQALNTAAISGFAELTRTFPNAREHCDSPGCGDVRVTQPEQNQVEIEARYRVPLSWPTSALLQTQSAMVSTRRRENLEIAATQGRDISGNDSSMGSGE